MPLIDFSKGRTQIAIGIVADYKTVIGIIKSYRIAGTTNCLGQAVAGGLRLLSGGNLISDLGAGAKIALELSGFRKYRRTATSDPYDPAIRQFTAKMHILKRFPGRQGGHLLGPGFRVIAHGG